MSTSSAAAAAANLPVPLSTPSLDVMGRIFLVTGGTQGLGLEIASQLKSNGATAIVLVSRSPDKMESALKQLNCTDEKTVLSKTETKNLLARIKKLVSMWADEEQRNGNNVFYWNILNHQNMAIISSKVPTTVEELASCDISENIIRQYGERLVKSINTFIEEENLEKYIENRPPQKKLKSDSSAKECVIKFVRADISNAAEASSVVPRAIELLEKESPLQQPIAITGFVNAAAVTSRGNLLTTTADMFDEQFHTNVRGPFLITQGAAKHMIERKTRGSIVNICSVAAKGGAPFIMGYSCAKSALVTLTKNNAAELAPHGIRVNGVNMGWCLTENESKLQTKVHKDEDWWKAADKSVPLGRILRPTDIASTVLFLLSGASNMITGSIIDQHPEYPCGMLSLNTEDNPDR